jgi:hypothetical protein
MYFRCAVAAASVVAAGVAGAAAETRMFDFAADAVDAVAAGFICDRTGSGRQGRWQILQDVRDGAPRKVLAQLDADAVDNRFPVCTRSDVSARDVDVSVAFKPISGGEDQAAGLVWRYANAKNYYIVRANALENNVVLYKVQNGQRSDLPLVGKGKTYGAKAPVPAKQWSTLRVVAKGNRFVVHLNGVELYTVEDTTFSNAGSVGVWTKADSVTYFSDLKVVVE